MATGGFLAVGMIGWLVGHLDPTYYSIAWVFAVLFSAGTVGFTVLVFVNSHRFRRPLIPQVMGLLSVLWAILLIGLNPDTARVLRYPMAVLVGLEVLLLIVGYRDLVAASKRWNSPRHKQK